MSDYASTVLIVRRGVDFQPQVLAVTNRGRGGLSLPGGKGEIGEDGKRTAVRELREETGLLTLHSDLVLAARGISSHPDSVRDVFCYFARHVSGSIRGTEDGTVPEWVPWYEFLGRSTFARWYTMHFPDGIYHLRSTIFDGGSNKSVRG